MFDITTARTITYGAQDSLSVTVFRDRTEAGIWYMAPVPRLRLQGGKPVFALTKYRSTAGGIAGICTFEVELYAPEEAKRAAEAKIGGISGWGQFTWTSGEAYFGFELPDGQKTVGRMMAQTPSLFGSNVAGFQLELESDAAVNTFIAAFTGPGTLSPFRMEYRMGALTQLLGASATVKYISTAAINYEKKYESRKDTWGNSKQVLVEVRQVLQESGAGDVNVTPGVGATPELLQLVRDWAWTTLEGQVARTVDAARALAQGNQSPVSATSDFTQTYSEDAIVEWTTPVSSALPRFDDETWQTLYHEVDNRELSVLFQLAGNPYTADGALLFEEVKIEVEYPTRTTDNTFLLIPGTDDRVSMLYVAPGEGVFNPEYRYRYTVYYAETEPFTSDWISDSATLISLRPNLFGIRNVSFIGTNIPFDAASDKGGVDRVFIDFFDNPPTGQPAKLQTQEMRANGEAVTFASTYHVPITNTYDYRLRHLLKDGSLIVSQPPRQFGSNNADLVQVFSPAPGIANLELRALVTAGGDGFLDINATAAYFDDQNPSERKPPNHMWSGWAPELKPGLYSAEPWRFDAQPDPQTAFFRLNGQIVFGNGDIFELTNLNLAYSKRPLILKDTDEIYGVEIFSNQVDWSAVAGVTINVFQEIDDQGSVVSGDLPVTASFVLTADQLRPAEAAAIAVRRTPLIPFTVLQPVERVKSLPLFYTLRKPRQASDLVFYFNADYITVDGQRRSIADTQVTNRLQLHLPPLPSEPAPGRIQRFAVRTR